MVSTGDASRDPRLIPLVNSLSVSGNEVVVVTAPNREPLPHVERVVVPGRVPSGRGHAANVLRRVQPNVLRRRNLARRIAAAAHRTGAQLFYPLARRDLQSSVDAAADAGAVFSLPAWGSAGDRDIAALASDDPRWGESSAGPGLMHHTKPPTDSGPFPQPGRHTGKKIALAYRQSATSPGRYLRTALERAGVQVDVHDGVIDFGRVAGDSVAVVVVESPYPAFDTRGTKPEVPILFWAHHGEHHLDANLRLVDRYQVDAVLLSHSWHLGHRFPVPVHRFPFAAAPEISGSGTPYGDRAFDVAMVAAGLNRPGGTYSGRRVMAARLEAAFGKGARFSYGLLPEAVGELYRTSRVVTNDGGTNHRPVTMRVFEAIGNGARLLTEDTPGLACLLQPGHYHLMSNDVVDDVRSIVGDDDSATAADEARRYVLAHHTYDHRVDELVAIADVTKAASPRPPPTFSSELALHIHDDVAVQTILDYSSPGLVQDLTTREIRRGEVFGDRIAPRSVDAVVLGSHYGSGAAMAALAARSFVYIDGAPGREVDEIVADHPDATVERIGSITRIDFNAGRYRQRPAGHPLA